MHATVITLIVLSLGCKGSSSSQSSAPPVPGAGSGSSAADAAALGVRTVAESSEGTFTTGIAIRTPSGLEVALADPPLTCAQRQADTSRLTLTFDVPRGPGLEFATGRDVGVWAQLSRPDGEFFAGLEPRHAVARLEPFEPRKGARIRGTIEFHRVVKKSHGDTTEQLHYDGNGAFEVEICDDPPTAALATWDPAAVTAKLGGTWSGKHLELTDGLAEIGRDADDGSLYLGGITFAAGESYDCASAKRKPARVQLDLSSIGGIAKARPLAGPQRVGVALEHPGKARDERLSSYLMNQDGHVEWVSFDELAWQPGGAIRGTLFAISAPGVDEPFHLMGTFKARVCDVSER